MTDDLNHVTVYDGAKTVSDLGIPWDIFESPRFCINITASFSNDAFLIAWRWKDKEEKPDPEFPDHPVIPDPDDPGQRHMDYIGYQWAHVDKYLNDIMHWHFWRLIDRANESGKVTGVMTFGMEEMVREILRGRMQLLHPTGDYPANLNRGDQAGDAAREAMGRLSHVIEMRSMLIVILVKAIQNMSAPVYEPWMLFEIFKWLGKSSVIVTRDRTFDLSPCWG